MQIRTRITFLFTWITATILLIFAALIYFTAKESREKEFYALLSKEAYTKVNLFLDAQVDKHTLQEIYRNNRKILNEVEVAIYSTDFDLLYHDAVDIDFVKETPEMLSAIASKGKVSFYQGLWQVVGLKYTYAGKEYIVTAAALDQYGYTKLELLLKNSILIFVLSIIILFIVGRLFSKRIFNPINQMTEKAQLISATNLDLRLESNNNKDELSVLANTFNQMLARLENSFDAQKNFVSNISHELRTPLSAIIAELELSTNRERSIAEYKAVIENTLNDAQKLVKLSNSLLDLAKASYDPSEIAFRPVRIDETLLDARQLVQRANTEYGIAIHFDSDIDDENQITVNGNEYLLKVAFVNLFENGCKFSSDKQCRVNLSFQHKCIVLEFTDLGIGIAPQDVEHIFLPFYRGENKFHVEGNGIGLSLTQKIIQLHQGNIHIQSTLNKGTTFTVELPHL